MEYLRNDQLAKSLDVRISEVNEEQQQSPFQPSSYILPQSLCTSDHNISVNRFFCGNSNQLFGSIWADGPLTHALVAEADCNGNWFDLFSGNHMAQMLLV